MLFQTWGQGLAEQGQWFALEGLAQDAPLATQRQWAQQFWPHLPVTTARVHQDELNTPKR
jgi:hypothetical protein